MCDVMIKDLLSGEFSKYNISNDQEIKRIKLSNFIPVGLKSCVDMIPPSNYLVCIGYQVDHQIGISGHPHEEENIEDAFRREIMEELSLGIKINPGELKYGSKGRKYSYLTISLGNMVLLPHLENEKKGTDKKDRVIICVHGSHNEVQNYLSKVTLSESNGDQIKTIWAIRRDLALSLIQEMTENGKRIYPDYEKKFYLDLH